MLRRKRIFAEIPFDKDWIPRQYIQDEYEKMLFWVSRWTSLTHHQGRRMAYYCIMRHLVRPSLVQIMHYCLFGAKPLSDPILAYSQLDNKKQDWVGSEPKCTAVHRFTPMNLKMYDGGDVVLLIPYHVTTIQPIWKTTILFRGVHHIFVK